MKKISSVFCALILVLGFTFSLNAADDVTKPNDTKTEKCGAGKCGDTKADKSGKCGAGKCGDTKADKPKADKSGKCGAGKCGGSK